MKSFSFTKSQSKSTSVSLALFAIGAILVIAGIEISGSGFKIANFDVGTILSNVGSFVGVVVVLQWVYDRFVRKDFFDEIFSAITASDSIAESGVVSVFPDAHDIPYADYIAKSSKLEIVVAHSSSFLNRHIEHLKNRVASGKPIDIYCLDKNSEAVEYLSKHGIDPSRIESSLNEIDNYYEHLKCDQSVYHVHKINVLPRYTVVIFDDIAFIRFSTTSIGKALVPGIAVKASSPLWKFFVDDLSRIKE